MAVDFSKILGVIFDMDGVLVDSEAVMANASVMGMADYKIYAKPEDFVPYFGTNEETYFGSVVKMHGGIYTKEIAEHIYDIYCDIAPSQIITFPKVPETLSELHNRGYKTAEEAKRFLENETTILHDPRIGTSLSWSINGRKGYSHLAGCRIGRKTKELRACQWHR